MSKREYRRFTAKQALEILKVAEQPGLSVSELSRTQLIAVSLLLLASHPAMPSGHRAV